MEVCQIINILLLHTLPFLKKVKNVYVCKHAKQNVYVHAQLFPYDFGKVHSIKSHRHHTVVLTVEDKLGKKLLKIRNLLGHDDIRVTIKHLLEKSIKLWEE
jgi:hypothetical protein